MTEIVWVEVPVVRVLLGVWVGLVEEEVETLTSLVEEEVTTLAGLVEELDFPTVLKTPEDDAVT